MPISLTRWKIVASVTFMMPMPPARIATEPSAMPTKMYWRVSVISPWISSRLSMTS